MTSTPKPKDKPKPRPVFKVDSPYTSIQWPQISPQQEEIILDMLINLLAPIGQYRCDHVPRSRGKRDRKRIKREERTIAKPPPPEIASHVYVGLNSVTKHLDDCARRKDPTLDAKPEGDEKPSEDPQDSRSGHHRSIAAVFFAGSTGNMSYAHLPLLCTSASSALKVAQATRLVPLAAAAETKLAAALRVPKASVVAIVEGAPRSQALIHYTRETVQEVKVPWLTEAQDGTYKSLSIEAAEPG